MRLYYLYLIIRIR